ncbi:MAG: response regulator [Steroidobacteraceae bacterium]
MTDLVQGSISARAAGSEDEAVPKRASVLMVDDQPARLLTYESILHGLNVDCVRALSGAEALQRLLSQEFAAILLDVNMPDMDGFEVARLIREHPRLEKTPIVFITGVHISELDRIKGYEVGAIDYISVPVVPEILRTKVAVLVELHQRRSELQALNEALEISRTRLAAEHTKVVEEKTSQLRAIFENPSQLSVVLHPVRDDAGAIVDWIYEDANASALAFLHHTRESLLGLRVSAVLPDRTESTIRRCAEALTTRKPVRWELCAGGRYLLATAFAVGANCVIASGTEITEQKATEEALRASEFRYRMLIENAPVGVAHNALSGEFLYANRGFCELVGYTVEELRALTWQAITHPDDIDLDQSLANRVLAGEIPHYTAQKRYIRKDGTVVWIDLFGSFVADEFGKPIEALAVAIDISERKRAEVLLKENDRRKDEFLAMLAHELRNPIAPIRNAAEVLGTRLKDTSEQAVVAIIRRQTTHLSQLLDDLLDVARITSGHIELRREVIAIQDCIDSAVEAVEPLIREKGHRLTLTNTFTPLFVEVDKVRIAQCLTNLLTNAVKFTPSGGDVRILPFVDGSEVVIEVSDSGIGMSAEFLPRAFGLFAQSERTPDRSQGGLGVGLSVCKKLLDMHGGSISAQSAGAGLGSTFTVRIPLMSAPDEGPIAASIPAQQKRRVLIVDDNHDAADSLALLLQMSGHDTCVAYSAEDGLRSTAELQPDIVLLDIGLPRMDGYEVARQLRGTGYKSLLIALSGYGQEEDRAQSSAAGFDAHLVKPVDADELMRALANASSR